MADSRLNIVIDADTARAKREINGFKGSFTELKSQLDLAVMGFQAVRDAAIKAFEFAKQGAELDRTRGQLESLAISIGTTADTLIERMGAATGGLMSNAEMISSATQIISLGLADNETDVIRLATIVSELGWDMQQVILTFANNSTMRLDALGLSVQDVTTKAKALEEQGFDADKAFDLAVLEAAEEKIALVGSAAETAAGQYKVFEANIANVTDNLKLLAAEAFTPVVSGANRYFAAQVALNDALAMGAITTEELHAIQTQLKFSTDDYLDSIDLVQEKIDNYNEKQEIMRFGQELLNLSMTEAKESTVILADELDPLAMMVENTGLRASQAARWFDDLGEAAEDAAPEIMTFAEAMDAAAKGRPSAVAGLIEDIKWLQAGGADVGQLIADIEGALEAGIDPAAVGDTLATALVGSLLASMQAGQTDFEGASQTLQDTLGIDAAEADAMLSEFENAADAIAEAERELQYQIVLDQQSQEILNSLTAVLGVDSHTVNISLVGQTRGAQSFSGTSVGWDPTGPGDHFGTDFVVPSGHNNDGFPMRVESGERVTVTPASEVASGRGGMGAPSQIIVMLDGEQIAARVMTKAGRDYRTTRANGGGYTGR